MPGVDQNTLGPRELRRQAPEQRDQDFIVVAARDGEFPFLLVDGVFEEDFHAANEDVVAVLLRIEVGPGFGTEAFHRRRVALLGNLLKPQQAHGVAEVDVLASRTEQGGAPK